MNRQNKPNSSVRNPLPTSRGGDFLFPCHTAYAKFCRDHRTSHPSTKTEVFDANNYLHVIFEHSIFLQKIFVFVASARMTDFRLILKPAGGSLRANQGVSHMKCQKIAGFLFLFSLVGQSAFADCKDGYANEVKRLDSMENSARATFATSGVPAVGIPLILLATGATITTAGVIAAPLAVVGAGGFYAGLALRKTSLRRTLKLIQNAEAGNGKFLSEVTAEIRKEDSRIDESQIAEEIIALNEGNLICPANDLGRQHFMGYARIQGELRKHFNIRTLEVSDF